jgi:hypothetical protein
MGVPGPEKLLADLPELALSGKEPEQRSAAVFHANQGQQRDDGQ